MLHIFKLRLASCPCGLLAFVGSLSNFMVLTIIPSLDTVVGSLAQLHKHVIL